MRISRRVFIAVPLVYMSACGGSATHDGSGDPMALIQDACANITSLSCPNGMTVAECESELQDERAEAAEDGCAAAFDAIVSCVANASLTCGANTKDFCGAETEALQTCDSEQTTWQDECSGSHSGYNPGVDPPGWERCDSTCPGFELVCERFEASAPLVCTCTKGAKTGASFEVTHCSEAPLQVAKDFCG